MLYNINRVEHFLIHCFENMGCPETDAKKIARVFMAAEERGIPSHGLLRLKDYYELWKAGRIQVEPVVKIVHETPSTGVVDGGNGIGMIPAHFSMEVAIKKAKTCGTGWVATRNSNHYGIAGYYAMMALEHDMIGICMTNANPLVAPTFSISRLLGTNPIAVAIPAQEEPPFVADFATTPIARGKLAVAETKGELVPEGYVQDKEGNPSRDPSILKSGGAMLGLGGDYEHGSHKGYCMAAIVDIFSAVFSGANFGPYVPPSVAYLPLLEEQVGDGIGHFFGAMRIDAWQEANQFKEKMDQWIQTFRNASSAPGKPKVLIPGDIERELEKKHQRHGIPLLPVVIEHMKEIAAALDVTLPNEIQA